MIIDWNSVVSITTAVGVMIAAFQLRAGSKIAQTEFEDSIDQQYRHLARDIPVDALIGKAVDASKAERTRELIYNYLDLCNEQVFLRFRNRIRKDTWHDWCQGIKANLHKQEFAKVWEEVKTESPNTFSFLERLEKHGYQADPAAWRSKR